MPYGITLLELRRGNKKIRIITIIYMEDIKVDLSPLITQMNEYKCKKCGNVVGEGETYLATEEGKIATDPRRPEEQETSFPRPVRRHKGCDGEVEAI